MTHTKTTQRSLWDKLWRDRRGRVVIFQMPNIWLIGWVILTCVSLLTSSRSAANIFWWASSTVLAIWALLEIFDGATYFRRLLGLAVLCMTVASILGVGL